MSLSVTHNNDPNLLDNELSENNVQPEADIKPCTNNILEVNIEPDSKSDSDKVKKSLSCFNLSSCSKVVIGLIGNFLSFEEIINFAAISKTIKAGVFTCFLLLCPPIRNLESFKIFLTNNPNISFLELVINPQKDIPVERKVERSNPNLNLIQEFLCKIIHLDLTCSYPDLDWFDQMIKLRALALFNCRMNVALCANFPRVSTLILKNYTNSFSGEVLRCLPLQKLDLDNCPLIKLEDITNLPHLSQLSLRNTRDVTIPSFTGCSNLQILELEEVTPITIRPLNNLEKLQEFVLIIPHEDGRKVMDLDCFQNCTALTSVVLRTQCSCNISALTTCSSLKKLNIYEVSDLVDISFITQLPCIYTVRVDSADLDITNISEFPFTLTDLKLSGKRMNGGVRFTSEIRSIDFDFDEYHKPMSCLDSVLVQRNLKYLALNNCAISREEKYIAKLVNLEVFYGDNFTNTNMRMFGELTQLHTIGIYNSDITTLYDLRYCTRLKCLYLKKNRLLRHIDVVEKFLHLEEIDFVACPHILHTEVVAMRPKLTHASFDNCGTIWVHSFEKCATLQTLIIDKKVIIPLRDTHS